MQTNPFATLIYFVNTMNVKSKKTAAEYTGYNRILKYRYRVFVQKLDIFSFCFNQLQVAFQIAGCIT